MFLEDADNPPAINSKPTYEGLKVVGIINTGLAVGYSKPTYEGLKG
mgnify:CR=1 FL=1